MHRVFATSLGSWFLLLSIAIAGCGHSTSDSDSADEGKGVIGYSALALENAFFKTIADTMEEEANSHGYELLVNDAKKDAAQQAAHIDNYIARQVVAIVINPADRKGMGAAIKRANEAGIPVFTNDTKCVADGVKIAGHAGTDNLQGGEVAGAAMIEVLGKTGGEVGILHFPQAHSCVLRVQGFKKVIDAHNKENPDTQIKIVTELEGGGQQGKSTESTTAMMTAHPEISAIFAINDPSALGAYKALEESGRAGKVTIIGFDGELAGRKAIKAGKIYADPIQFPKKMARVTIENIVKYQNGEAFEMEQLFPTELYRKSDADADPELP